MTPAPTQPSEPDWDDGKDLDLDAIGLAAEFGAYVRRGGIAPEDQRQALGDWLDEMIAELDADAEADVEAEAD